VDEIMRDLQGGAQKVAVESFAPVSMWVGMALSENKGKTFGAAEEASLPRALTGVFQRNR